MKLKILLNCLIQNIPDYKIQTVGIGIFLVMAQTQSNAATLLSWEFDGNSGNEASVTANTIISGLGAGSGIVTRGAGLTASNNGDRFNATNWATSNINNAVSGNDYMEFSLNYNGSNSITVDMINFIWQRSGTGTTGLAIRSSLDGYGTNLATFFLGGQHFVAAFCDSEFGEFFRDPYVRRDVSILWVLRGIRRFRRF